MLGSVFQATPCQQEHFEKFQVKFGNYKNLDLSFNFKKKFIILVRRFRLPVEESYQLFFGVDALFYSVWYTPTRWVCHESIGS